jgi:hypothetical protein
VKRFSELLTEAALPKKEPAPKAEPTPTESAESLSKKAVNASKTADQTPFTAPYGDQHALHLTAADAHHEAANGHLTASQSEKHKELHAMHSATHRSIARNHEKVAAIFATGAASSGKKTVKEEVDPEEFTEEALAEALEMLAELKKTTLASYVKKASFRAGQSMRAYGETNKTKHVDKAMKREAGIAKAVDKLAESFVGMYEGLDMLDILSNPFLVELDKSTLASYVKKASVSAASSTAKGAHHADNAQGHRDIGSHQRAATEHGLANKHYRKAAKRLNGVSTASDKLKEEVEPTLLEAIISAARGIRASGYDASGDVAAAKERAAKRKESQLKVIREKYPVKKAEGSDEAKKAREAAKRDMKEEVEPLQELSKPTLGAYIKKAANNLGSNMVRSVQGKGGADTAAKREKGISTAASKLSEEVAPEFILEFRQPIDHATLRGKKAKDGSTILYDRHGDIPADKDQQKKIVAKAHELRVAKAKSASAVKEDTDWTDISNLLED